MGCKIKRSLTGVTLSLTALSLLRSSLKCAASRAASPLRNCTMQTTHQQHHVPVRARGLNSTVFDYRHRRLKPYQYYRALNANHRRDHDCMTHEGSVESIRILHMVSCAQFNVWSVCQESRLLMQLTRHRLASKLFEQISTNVRPQSLHHLSYLLNNVCTRCLARTTTSRALFDSECPWPPTHRSRIGLTIRRCRRRRIALAIRVGFRF